VAGLRAVVLAAGRGVRMGMDMPKTLAPVDNGKPLLHYILKGLALAGVSDLLVVTGYKPADVSEFVTEHWSTGSAAFVRNARWASWGNFHSLRVGIDQSPEAELLVVNSDIVIHPQVFRRVVATRGDLVLAIEQKAELDPEEMRVTLEGERVVAIGKRLDMAASHGEFAGVSLLREETASVYSSIATDLEWRAETQVFYEDVYARLLARVDARAAAVQGGEYAEVDNPGDLDGARSVLERHREAWASPEAAEEERV
jgi:choline kinase